MGGKTGKGLDGRGGGLKVGKVFGGERGWVKGLVVKGRERLEKGCGGRG